MHFFKKIFNNINLFFYHGFNYNEKIKDAYFFLKESGKIEIIDKIRYEIEHTKIQIDLNKFSYLKKNINFEEDLNITYTQILHLKYVVNSSFSSALAVAIHKKKNFFSPLPKEWLQILIKNNIKVSYTFSRILFFFYSINFFLKDFSKIVVTSFSKQDKIDKKNTIIYLDNLSDIDFEVKFFNDKYNFLYWLKNFLKIDNKITFIHNNKKSTNRNFSNIEVKYLKFFFLNNLSIYERFILILYTLYSTIILLYYVLRGNIFFSHLLENFYLAICLKKFKSKAPDYAIYDTSNCLIRPWWTFLLENKKNKINNKVFLFFFSSNHFPFYSYESPMLGCRWFNWSNYVFWTNEQCEWLKKINNSFSQCHNVGYFPSFGKNEEISKTKKIISVFPVTPFCDEYARNEFTNRHYYTLETSLKFLKDIIDGLKYFDVEIILKLKRNNPQSHKKYIQFINELNKEKKITIINSNISAISLIDKSDAVISSPYSSTGLIAEYFNKPSIFYDSSHSLVPVEPYIKKIRLVKNFDELSHWIKKILD